MVKFLKLRSEVFIATLIDALCLHFVIPVAEIVLSFPDKKSKFPQLLLLPGSCPKSARSAPDNVLRVLQISSRVIVERVCLVTVCQPVLKYLGPIDRPPKRAVL